MALLKKGQNENNDGIIVNKIYEIPEVRNLLLQHRFKEVEKIGKDVGPFKSEINIGNNKYYYDGEGNSLKFIGDLAGWIADQCPETRNYEKKKKGLLNNLFSSNDFFDNVNYKRIKFCDYLKTNPSGLIKMEDKTLWKNDGTLDWEKLSNLLSEEGVFNNGRNIFL